MVFFAVMLFALAGNVFGGVGIGQGVKPTLLDASGKPFVVRGVV